MERRSPSFIELHCEKLLLGATLALALYLAWTYLLGSPNTLLYDGRNLTPSGLNKLILQEAQALEQRMRAVDAPPPEVPRFHRRLRESHEAGIFSTDNEEADQLLLSRQLRLATTFGAPVDACLPHYAPVRLLAPVPPTQPTLLTGRSLAAAGPARIRQAEQDAAEVREITWVRISARFDREQQRQALLAAGYPPYSASVHLAAVDAQRQELLAVGGFSPWQDVEPPEALAALKIPAPLFDDRSGRLVNRGVLDAALAQLKASQALLVRPPLGEVIAGDRPPALAADPEETDSDEGKDCLLLWVYDEHAQAGKTYRYRLRVRLWNRFVGRPHALQDAADAKRVVLSGEWSQPSEPITAAPQVHLFILGRSVDKTGANVEVWKWHRGRWLRKSLVAKVGDAIGGVARVKTGDLDESGRPIRERIDFNSGAVMLDIRRETRAIRVAKGETGRFEWVETPTLVVVYHDPADERIKEKLHLADRADPLRKRLGQP